MPESKPPPYSPGDVVRGYGWLGHEAGFTEVCVLHPEYKPGENAWNRVHGAWPITRYVTTAAELSRIVRRYAGERLICYGLNPRPGVLMRPDGRLRSAADRDITRSQNLLLDIDLQGDVTPERRERLSSFLDTTAAEYFASLGINQPARPSTGRGNHLLFAFPHVFVRSTPNFRGQLRTFKDEFTRAHQQDLSKLEARVDSTQDLRRMVRAYGTSKPHIGITSTFPADERVPDERLRHYLLTLTPAPVPAIGLPRKMVLTDLMPSWFHPLRERHPVLNDLWHGRGKPSNSDTSSSGYDYSITTYLVRHGIRNPDDLLTILALRPRGATERSTKGVDYLLRTIQNALQKVKAK